MIRVLAVVRKATSEVVEFVTLEDRRFPDPQGFLDAARRETHDLSTRYRLPNDELELFDGSDRSIESFFRMFPNLKVTPRTVRPRPR